VSVEDAIERTVAARLEAELRSRGLLVADAESARDGESLLDRLVRLQHPEQAVTIEFDDEHAAARIEAALAFGAATAHALAQDVDPAVELICATFNLGIGLIDGVCDADAERGAALLELVREQDLVAAAERPQAAASTPPGADATVAFTLLVVGAFFQLLHTAYPGDARLPFRRRVGEKLTDALEAERATVARPADAAHAQLVEWSRLTSVLPFEIIDALVGGTRGAGTQLGEAMWRIDDLVDLCADARSGSLNGVLLSAPDGLEGLLESTAIEDAAATAADCLADGLRAGGGDPAAFLGFVQRYAGLG